MLWKFLEDLICGFLAFLELPCFIQGQKLFEKRSLLGRKCSFRGCSSNFGHRKGESR